MSNRNEIKIGVVGLGLGQWHVETITEIEGARVTAVADNISGNLPGTNLTVASYADKYGTQAFRDGVELIASADIDAVSICTSPKWRLPLVEAAAKRKLPILLEKPWGANMDHGHQIAQLLQDAGITNMVEFPLRFFPAIKELKRLLDNGPIGKPYMINSEIVMGAYATKVPDHWLWDPNNGNGAINENTCHVFDTLCYLLGDPAALHAFGGNFSGVASTPDGAVINIRFANGAVASVTGGGLGATGMRMRAWFDVFAAAGQALVTGIDHMPDTLTWAKLNDTETTSETWQNPPRRRIVRYALEHFIECVRNGKQPDCDVTDGMKALAIAMAVNESITTGQPVELSW